MSKTHRHKDTEAQRRAPINSYRRAFVPVCLCVSVFFTIFVFAQGRGGRGAAARQRSNKKVILAWADTRNGVGQHESVSHALAVIERLEGQWRNPRLIYLPDRDLLFDPAAQGADPEPPRLA